VALQGSLTIRPHPSRLREFSDKLAAHRSVSWRAQAMETRARGETISVYWQPGCTSCLRTKEFLTRHGVTFISRNVLEDATAFSELARFGLKQVPIVTRGDEWADGQVLRDVARIAGITFGGPKLLPVPELGKRLDAILRGAERLLGQLPEQELKTQLPNRPRSYAELAFHIFNIADAFLEHEAGIRLTFDAYNRVPPPDMQNSIALAAYGQDVRRRLDAWFAEAGAARDWTAKADVYYGAQTMHEFLERTTWHAGQHTRQLMWVLKRSGVEPQQPLGPEIFEGLPMPQNVWDDD
jgi:glutaredoxin